MDRRRLGLHAVHGHRAELARVEAREDAVERDDAFRRRLQPLEIGDDAPYAIGTGAAEVASATGDGAGGRGAPADVAPAVAGVRALRSADVPQSPSAGV